MSNTIKITDELLGIGIFNKTISFSSPLQLPKNKEVNMRISRVQISDRIPNVFDANPYGIEFDNRRVRIGTDVHPWVTIQLDPGLYISSDMIQAAINATINSLGWWADSNDPGFLLQTNAVIDRFNIIIDSTKLLPLHGTQFYFDLQESTTNSSKMWYTLGFTSTSVFMADGVYTSSMVPNMDTQGTSCVVCCTIMPPRLVNTDYQPYVADVDFSGKLDASDIVWPQGNIGNDMIVYSGPKTINQATMYVLTDKGLPMVFLNGRLQIEILFYW